MRPAAHRNRDPATLGAGERKAKADLDGRPYARVRLALSLSSLLFAGAASYPALAAPTPEEIHLAYVPYFAVGIHPEEGFWHRWDSVGVYYNVFMHLKDEFASAELPINLRMMQRMPGGRELPEAASSEDKFAITSLLRDYTNRTHGADGAFAFWQVVELNGARRVVAVLYLPEGIHLLPDMPPVPISFETFVLHERESRAARKEAAVRAVVGAERLFDLVTRKAPPTSEPLAPAAGPPPPRGQDLEPSAKAPPPSSEPLRPAPGPPPPTGTKVEAVPPAAPPSSQPLTSAASPPPPTGTGLKEVAEKQPPNRRKIESAASPQPPPRSRVGPPSEPPRPEPIKAATSPPPPEGTELDKVTVRSPIPERETPAAATPPSGGPVETAPSVRQPPSPAPQRANEPGPANETRAGSSRSSPQPPVEGAGGAAGPEPPRSVPAPAQATPQPSPQRQPPPPESPPARAEKPAPKPSFTAAFLDLSEDWVQSTKAVRSQFKAAGLPSADDVRKVAQRSFGGQLAQAKRPDAPPLTYLELTAPRFTIDADPKALEKRLGKICRSAAVDVLFFGHLRQERVGRGVYRMELVLRAFSQRQQRILTAQTDLLDSDRSAERDSKLESLLLALVRRLGLGPSAAALPAGTVEYTVKDRDTLTAIAKRCYAFEQVGRLLDELVRLNGLQHKDQIRIDQKLFLPPSLGGKPLDKEKCR